MKLKIKGPFNVGMKIQRGGKTFIVEDDGHAYFSGSKKECEHLALAYCHEVEVEDENTVDESENGSAVDSPEVADAPIASGEASEVVTETAPVDAGEAETENAGDGTAEPVKMAPEASDESGEVAEVAPEAAEVAPEAAEVAVEAAKKPRARKSAKKAD